jgi:hypothetical protein
LPLAESGCRRAEKLGCISKQAAGRGLKGDVEARGRGEVEVAATIPPPTTMVGTRGRGS